MLPDIYENEYFRADTLRKVVIDGHEVVWIKTTAQTGYVEYMTSCQCGFDVETGEFNPWYFEIGISCKYTEAAMALRRCEVMQDIGFNPDDLDIERKFPYVSGALKDAIVELFERSQRHEWLGLYSDRLYGRGIKQILDVDMEDIWTCVQILEREGKLASGTGTGAAHAGEIVKYDARRKRKYPEHPYSEKNIGTFTIKILAPLSGFEPLEWYIKVLNSCGKKVYEERVPVKYCPKWSLDKEKKFHAADIARLNLALAELEENIWDNFIEYTRK